MVQALVISPSRTRGPPSFPELVLALYDYALSMCIVHRAAPLHVTGTPISSLISCRGGEDDMTQTFSIESAIHEQLSRVGTCSLDELAALLPGYSWAQVFAAVDRLTREGNVALKHPAPFRYLLSLAPHRSAEARHVMQS